MFDLSHIVETDFRKNHQGRSYDCALALDAFKKYVDLGLLYYRTETVVIVYNLKDDCIEFHCMNAGTGADLTAAINSFLTDVAVVMDRAVTYYDNPRINDLVKYSKYPATVRRIDGGEDKTFEMSFDLRGM